MDFYLGQIILFAGMYEVENWMRCDGRELSIRDYQALYSILGNCYGGDPMKTFRLPDLRNAVPAQSQTARAVGVVTQAPLASKGLEADAAASVPAGSPTLALNYLICVNGVYPMRRD